jgi:quercetin dioxygenase-like cupin family protein
MKIIKMDQVQESRNKNGVTIKQLFMHENVRVTNLVLNPGDQVPSHHVEVDVFFYVVSGKGTIEIGNEKAVVEASDIILCPPNTNMGLIADQEETFNVLNVKTPNAKEYR